MFHTYYLNNSGSRWVNRNIENKNISVSFELDGITYIRRAKYFYSFGNFAGVAVSFNNKIYKTLNFKLLEF
jgi:hypothetical protein